MLKTKKSKELLELEEFLLDNGIEVDFQRTLCQNRPQWAKGNNYGYHYEVVIRNRYDGTKVEQMSFEFWDSLFDKQNRLPLQVDSILGCLEFYPIESFEDFCLGYGYEEDSRKAFRLYKKCKKLYKDALRVFGEDNLEKLREML